jgi:hypothetical protein
MTIKYIMTEYSPVVFNECITHADAAIGLGVIKSAGFLNVTFDTEKERFECFPYGESISLGVKCDKEADTIKLNRMFNNQL